MASDIFSFNWSVPQNGYRWIQCKVLVNERGIDPRMATNTSKIEDDERWVLASGIALGQTFYRKVYSPLHQFPALFRTLAQIKNDDKEAILAFANEYGDLGIGRPLAITAQDNPNRLLGMWGETFDDWRNEVDELQWAVRIWEMIQTRDLAGLSKHIRFQEGGMVPRGSNPIPVQLPYGWIFSSHPDLGANGLNPDAPIPPEVTFRTELIPPVSDLFTLGDVVTPAIFLVQRWVNAHMEGHVASNLLYNLDLKKQVLQLVPANLIAAIWLQLAQAIAGNKQYRTCKECGNWFEVAAGNDGRTARRLFCSDSCKSKDYRKSKIRKLAGQFVEEARQAVADKPSKQAQTKKKKPNKTK